jgi:hypothetical protein
VPSVFAAPQSMESQLHYLCLDGGATGFVVRQEKLVVVVVVASHCYYSSSLWLSLVLLLVVWGHIN